MVVKDKPHRILVRFGPVRPGRVDLDRLACGVGAPLESYPKVVRAKRVGEPIKDQRSVLDNIDGTITKLLTPRMHLRGQPCSLRGCADRHDTGTAVSIRRGTTCTAFCSAVMRKANSSTEVRSCSMTKMVNVGASRVDRPLTRESSRSGRSYWMSRSSQYRP